MDIVHLLHDYLAKPDNRGCPLSPCQRVALTLSFYASDSFLRVVGLFVGVKKTCAHTAVQEVTGVLCTKSRDFIAMSSPMEMRESAEKLRDRFKIPLVALGVDGTHIRLDHSPNRNELPNGVHTQDFWCRKQFYSVNVQLIGDGFSLIRDFEVKWAGSTHDSRIWRNSPAKIILEQQTEFLIAGDSAYPISPVLVKPFKDTPTNQHRRFNQHLSGLRTACTENMIGVWKRRFPCLKMGLRTKLEKSLKIIRATGMLHNLAIVLKGPMPEDVMDEPEQEERPHIEANDINREPVTEAARKIQGAARRERLFQTFCNTIN
ncbi:hypothetical protein TCAL_09538 [Tigriopus californicus]|uniref:DDE Tnp4 domain-containing protein n=1 Tax=Tigriopus californicus TaxID=6832 RepID=A0A553P2U6_TIGCA|nr:hypothetical protein TCAL_09538 [Tigriopus californicus]|eukprot:TCALIF_09538-PA protein Name:"Similar to harbi1 Putative nuclease HARBI1 (Danio rerio)" AED:0.03 eAED:0.03 QI:0/-1/0/1/-1/1/1/0/317